MNELTQLKAPANSRRPQKRVGRGQASGQGKTAGRGGKGQKARTGNMNFGGFEGGQMPLQRRLPKYGFSNPFRTEYAVVNVESLAKFPDGSIVDAAALETAGVVTDHKDGLKILGDGELKTKLTVRANRFSESAKQKIESAGGKAEVIAVSIVAVETKKQMAKAAYKTSQEAHVKRLAAGKAKFAAKKK